MKLFELDFDAVVFDMDGLLIDSEPLWQIEEVALFRSLGIPFEPQWCLECIGQRTDAMIDYWFARYPWQGPSKEQVARRLIDAVVVSVSRKGQALPGALALIAALQAESLPLALASSSPSVLIEASLKRIGVRAAFSACCSAVDEPRGKPDPAVYLTAARRIGHAPSRCLAFEDSPSGVEAANAAGMTVIAVPSIEQFADPRFAIATAKLRSLLDLNLTR